MRSSSYPDCSKQQKYIMVKLWIRTAFHGLDIKWHMIQSQWLSKLRNIGSLEQGRFVSPPPLKRWSRAMVGRTLAEASDAGTGKGLLQR